MTYSTFLEYVLEEAGKIAMDSLGNVPSHIKNGDVNQVVTPADLGIGSLLKRRISEQFPQDSLIDEESGTVRGTSPVTWVIDPIDGTSNFAAGSPLFGVMVGVLEHGEPVAGGVALPALSDIYIAERGQGAHRNGRRLDIRTNSDVSQRLFAYGMDVYPSEIALDCRVLAGIASCCSGVRMSNSVFDCMMVATGAYAGFAHRRNRIWDCVAMHIIVEEAGGIFSSIDGSGLDYAHPLTRNTDIFSILAASPGCHQAMVNAIREHAAG